MLEILSTLTSIKVVVHKDLDEYEYYNIYFYWRSGDVTGSSEDYSSYYEEDNLLSPSVVRAIFDNYVDDPAEPSICISYEQLEELKYDGRRRIKVKI